jgi:hypothetical protein
MPFVCEIHVCHFCIYVIIYHFHQNNTIWLSYWSLTECKALTGDCLCTVQDKLTHDCLCMGWHSTCVNIQKKAKGLLDILLSSDVLKLKRAIAPKLYFQIHAHTDFFYCFRVWNHIQKFGETFFVHPVGLYISEWSLCVCWVGADVETDVANIQTHFTVVFQIL